MNKIGVLLSCSVGNVLYRSGALLICYHGIYDQAPSGASGTPPPTNNLLVHLIFLMYSSDHGPGAVG